MVQTKNDLAKRRRAQTLLTAILFLIPAFIFLFLFIAYPITDTFVLSTYKWNGIDPQKAFVGFENWKKLLGDLKFIGAFRNNILVMILSISIQLPIGMVLAVLLDMGGRKLNFLKVTYFLPMLMSSIAIGFLFKYTYDPQFGLISVVSRLFGGKAMVDILGNPKIALFAVILVICWQFVPFYMVYFLAGLTSISEEIYEAAIIDGATRNQYFWRIALPMMRGSIKTACILSMVGSLKYFDLIYVMTEGGPNGATELMATYMYKSAFVSMNMGYGSAIAAGMFLIITTISLLTMTLMNRKETEV
ncbi:carbohydrate ABC transporter permease [Cellulosilyticum sp. I15G10I2]|uniref:carbohydrate ABC transporter permease n=1 Tax=Cellulosilyticum sp. I15G10I2 TaxID=1892843 RepID=UPI00085BB6F9|nr:sugar ABC transporter permease [Cellulosilyticum sp. I15G10I2]